MLNLVKALFLLTYPFFNELQGEALLRTDLYARWKEFGISEEAHEGKAIPHGKRCINHLLCRPHPTSCLNHCAGMIHA